MKSAHDILKELGFRENASDSVKEAFLKHLIKTSEGVTVQTPTEKKQVVAALESNQNEQLNFFSWADSKNKAG
jgi:hypothetical protein